ncbi:MAG: hypothetical protein D6696_01455 [Acidobacteria bacterium]|nr:MAG: hypothetical protein D6696_01455 [Acidobacteriota bacterium]
MPVATPLIRLALAIALAAAGGPEPPPPPPPPATDVYLLAVTAGETGIELGRPENLTDRPGYDNQPRFLPGGRALVYTSIDDAGQADVMRLELASRARRPVARTPESEYSPTPIPGDPGGLSVVRVEADGRQRLWRLPLDGGRPTLLLPDLEPVGYHAWVDRRHLLLFVLGSPPTLQLATVGAGEGTILARDVGRALAAIPGDGRMSFVHKRGDGDWWVTAIDPDRGHPRPLVRTPTAREDFAWAPDGSLWMGDGSRLLRWRRGQDGWQEVADLAAYGLHDVTRLAFDDAGRRLALVAARPAAP